ncbi:hotdog fold thioesterase [Bacillus aerolatus]|uniref:Hotdog fold thioesterase n=1 Tax=Bacillus aerolatus TaxID=2653354 RepID=A0A6I1FHM4_9BACI|nr:PaaI family thioesterase [Bacillus aerolatus]KAB7707812.1 hotdog fold thioesterase [Bacillus aerolatus]
MLLEDIVKEFEECPFLQHLGLEILQFEEGDVKIKLAMKDYLLNTNNTLHGGVYASVLDFIQSMHLRSVTKTRCVTTNLTVHYTAPVTGGEIFAEAEIISKGYKTAFVEGTIKDETGKLLSKGTGTFKLIRPDQ